MKVKRIPQDELYHHGIKGQRWGIRRYQNEDGSLTAAGRQRYGQLFNEQYKNEMRYRKKFGKLQDKMYKRYGDAEGYKKLYNGEQYRKLNKKYHEKDEELERKYEAANKALSKKSVKELRKDIEKNDVKSAKIKLMDVIDKKDVNKLNELKTQFDKVDNKFAYGDYYYGDGTDVSKKHEQLWNEIQSTRKKMATDLLGSYSNMKVKNGKNDNMEFAIQNLINELDIVRKGNSDKYY